MTRAHRRARGNGGRGGAPDGGKRHASRALDGSENRATGNGPGGGPADGQGRGPADGQGGEPSVDPGRRASRGRDSSQDRAQDGTADRAASNSPADGRGPGPGNGPGRALRLGRDSSGDGTANTAAGNGPGRGASCAHDGAQNSGAAGGRERGPRGARRLRPAVVCVSTLCASTLLLAGFAPAAAARPYDPAPQPAVPLTTLLSRLQGLYLQTESATESYNQAKQIADTQRAQAAAVDGQLAAQRVAVAASRDQVAVLANQMYQQGGVSPYLALLSGQTPQDFFGQRHVLGRAAAHQKDVLAGLTAGEARLSALNTQAQRALDKAQHAQSVQAARKNQVEASLRQVEATLAGLTGVQVQQLQTLEQQGENKSQQDFMDAKPLGDDPALRAPSALGDRALDFAFRQLGKPYVWGAQGPAAYDCSGLTSQAWAHAGTVIPRTSQEQWARLPHVPLALLRPGDLVIYFAKATHVAIYIGGGLIIQAPRPGSVVKVSPIAANPVLGAVRPDLGAQPLAHYAPRHVPKSAERPTPLAPPLTPDGQPADAGPATPE
jgi:cell wall-associated NlpC family hydrolase